MSYNLFQNHKRTQNKKKSVKVLHWTGALFRVRTYFIYGLARGLYFNFPNSVIDSHYSTANEK